jgi:hypothetical protein
MGGERRGGARLGMIRREEGMLRVWNYMSDV